MEDIDLSVLLLAILPSYRLSEIQRDRLWHRICVGLDPPSGKQKRGNRRIKEVRYDGTENKHA